MQKATQTHRLSNKDLTEIIPARPSILIVQGRSVPSPDPTDPKSGTRYVGTRYVLVVFKVQVMDWRK